LDYVTSKTRQDFKSLNSRNPEDQKKEKPLVVEFLEDWLGLLKKQKVRVYHTVVSTLAANNFKLQKNCETLEAALSESQQRLGETEEKLEELKEKADSSRAGKKSGTREKKPLRETIGSKGLEKIINNINERFKFLISRRRICLVIIYLTGLGSSNLLLLTVKKTETCRIIQSLAVDSPKAQVMEPAEPVEPPKELHLGVEIVFMGAIASLTFIILSVALSSWGVDPTVLNEVDPLILNSILERLLDQREFLMEVAKNLKEIDEFGKKNNYHHLPSNLLLGIPH
jgi:hypothetical protein